MAKRFRIWPLLITRGNYLKLITQVGNKPLSSAYDFVVVKNKLNVYMWKG